MPANELMVWAFMRFSADALEYANEDAQPVQPNTKE